MSPIRVDAVASATECVSPGDGGGRTFFEALLLVSTLLSGGLLADPADAGEMLITTTGKTPDLMAKMRPHLTLYSSYGPGRSTTDPVALDAIMLLRKQGGLLPFEHDVSGEQVVQVVATASSADGASFTRRSILRIDPSAKDRPCAILAWER